jgi:hypothetical protein
LPHCAGRGGAAEPDCATMFVASSPRRAEGHGVFVRDVETSSGGSEHHEEAADTLHRLRPGSSGASS